MAEQAGDATPDASQRLLDHAEWDADAVGEVLRDSVVEYLADDSAVLMIDGRGS